MIKTQNEFFAKIQGQFILCQSYGEAAIAVFNARKNGFAACVVVDSVRVYDHTAQDIARAKAGVKANALAILAACAGH